MCTATVEQQERGSRLRSLKIIINMHEQKYDTLDLTPEVYREYRRRHGPHFTKRLCDFAVSLMTRKDGQGNDIPITPMEREEVDRILKDYDIRLENQAGYDHVFAANMCKADYLGDSVPDIAHLARYVKNTIDDPDGYDGMVFQRWFTDMCHKHVEVPWEEVT